MKVFFDTNVYIAEALLGRAAERMINATSAARWRIYCSTYALGEVQTVLLRLGFAKRLATLTQDRIKRRSSLVAPPPSRHAAPAIQTTAPSCAPLWLAARITW